MIRFALALALLPQALAAQDLPTPLEVLEDIQQAMLSFPPQGDALYAERPAGPAWTWDPLATDPRPDRQRA